MALSAKIVEVIDWVASAINVADPGVKVLKDIERALPKSEAYFVRLAPVRSEYNSISTTSSKVNIIIGFSGDRSDSDFSLVSALAKIEPLITSLQDTSFMSIGAFNLVDDWEIVYDTSTMDVDFVLNFSCTVCPND